MRNRDPGKSPHELWSHGTRIFERRDERWQMIHQRVSFPYEQDSGGAVFGVEAAEPPDRIESAQNICLPGE